LFGCHYKISYNWQNVWAILPDKIQLLFRSPLGIALQKAIEAVLSAETKVPNCTYDFNKIIS